MDFEDVCEECNDNPDKYYQIPLTITLVGVRKPKIDPLTNSPSCIDVGE